MFQVRMYVGKTSLCNIPRFQLMFFVKTKQSDTYIKKSIFIEQEIHYNLWSKRRTKIFFWSYSVVKTKSWYSI